MSGAASGERTEDQQLGIRLSGVCDIVSISEIERDRYAADAWSQKQIAEELARVPETRWYVTAQVADEVVGYAGLFFSPPDADVQTITVARAWSRRGIGRRLLAETIKAARELGCGRMFLEVRADNEAAIGMYRAVGFVRLGVRRNYYANGGDALNMRLRLSATAMQEAMAEELSGLGTHGCEDSKSRENVDG